jgi:hypothetical protein
MLTVKSKISKMADLIIALLQAIDADETIKINGENYDITHPLVNAVIYLANEYLTADDRHIHMRVLKQKGYNIFPGEQDRFGWLTGCIQLPRGVIVFG